MFVVINVVVKYQYSKGIHAKSAHACLNFYSIGCLANFFCEGIAMPAMTGDLQKTAGGRIALMVFAVAAAAFGIILYFGADLSLLDSQDACLAAHAADHGMALPRSS
jgi:hypothetical protein